MRRRNRSFLQDLDWAIIGLYGLLVLLGWFSIYAAVYDGMETTIFDLSQNHGKQLIWMGVASIVAILVMVIDSKFYTTFAYFIYGALIFVLIGVLVFGSTIKGSKSWFEIGGFSLQPAEFAKMATALALAKYLTALRVNLKNFKSQLTSFAIIGIPAALVLMQGDFGTALVFTVLILVLFREGLNPGYLITILIVVILSVLALIFDKFYLAGSLGLLLLASGYFLRKNKPAIAAAAVVTVLSVGYIFTVDFIFNNLLEERHRDRINVLVGKSGNDWNVNQSKIAIGSGGWTGKGFLNGTQTKFDFVPELSTDFIFCTVGEEHGFLGSSIVVILFFLLLWRIITIAERQRSQFTRIYGYGVASIIFFHFAINIGMTIGLAPVIGIPLPFFSYGGSSLISFTILLFILLKLDSDRLSVLR